MGNASNRKRVERANRAANSGGPRAASAAPAANSADYGPPVCIMGGKELTLGELLLEALSTDSVIHMHIADVMAHASGSSLMAANVTFVDREQCRRREVSVFEAARLLGASTCLEWLVREGLLQECHQVTEFIGDMAVLLERTSDPEEERQATITQRVLFERFAALGKLCDADDMIAGAEAESGFSYRNSRQVLAQVRAKSLADEEVEQLRGHIPVGPTPSAYRVPAARI